MSDLLSAGSLKEIRESGVKVVKGKSHGIAVFYHEGKVYAVDNRCPHMGFPLHQGRIRDCILTCEWHHARFDIQSGGTLDPWADDVTTYPVVVENGQVWVDPGHRVTPRNRVNEGGVDLTPSPRCRGTVDRHRKRLREGLEQNLSLVIAKAVVGLMEAGEPAEEVARIGVEFGTTHRRSGWRSGLTILTAMLNILPKLDQKGKVLALFQGLVHVARESAGEGTRFILEPLPEKKADIQRLFRWYRHAVEVRDTQGAERILLTAIRSGATEKQLTDMMMAAVTGHFYMDAGHVLDFHNKAFEMLERIGPEHRERVLTSLLPDLGDAERSEELHSWQSPVDLVRPLKRAFEAMKEIPEKGDPGAVDEEELIRLLLGDRPEETVQGMLRSLRRGLSPVRLSQLVTLAAGERIARFHVQNDFSDWIAVLHTFTHAHAVHRSLRRSPSKELLRGGFHTAMRIYLDRFLNIPAARRPRGEANSRQAPQDVGQLLALMNQQQQVAEAAEWVVTYLDRGGDKGVLFNTLGHALLREDAEFHSFQMMEAAWKEHDEWAEENSDLAEEAQRTMIIALARYLAAHAPTARELPHVARIAQRLHRGEKLFEEV
ncbi:Rieske (2Fe-2S) protein [Paludifilum halophilum]|uniref:(2Fe-2S)-binding protein n=1 Tax=Paludifilum halophilum TaxID=1642702 RepID=A0A235B5N3_9BACL|nr:Rieske (2Fe-2S) protein [Paludifilum halophilum]OYD07217.1 (2Fe-2S)-binding protein [Paludifilum halophilum]